MWEKLWSFDLIDMPLSRQDVCYVPSFPLTLAYEQAPVSPFEPREHHSLDEVPLGKEEEHDGR